ncbi:MAG: 50S ribosomal protein L10 [Acidimicrobiaceae bacterium]|nr:50S ribosomal protein L10 [Acidimicrobiaceae bacterium]MXW76665.1 50S ribosomal protein L10 [Acidimicrobiaceae bacterium]MYC43079.1 50S ribosomal protein L10 [Acidimicrobiaceae bacterium]MYD08245.1 50S ribosomal protein L10 [Acidimicrobiaceae bacterium]MYI58734.1 50S ribosomal protein L10 [Acidimicrobiaceae bacterium]
MKDPRPEKVAVVDELRQKFADADGTILTEYRGLDVPAMAELRNALREAGGEYKIYKNTLVCLAARDAGLEIEDLLVGPTALAFVAERPDGSDGDVAAVAKALREFAKTNELLVIKGGVLGNKPLNSDNIKALAALPSRDVLLAQLAGAFQAPMAKFAGLLSAVPRQFAYALSALIEDRGGAESTTDVNTTDETTAEDAVAAESDETQTQTEASADADAGDAGESGEASQEKEA